MSYRVLHIFSILFTALSCGALAACSSADSKHADTPVPRPHAFPRVDIYPAEYRILDSLPLAVTVNSHAGIIRKPSANPSAKPSTKNSEFSVSSVFSNLHSSAADIRYPNYGATVHLSVIRLPRPDSAHIMRLTDDRIERIGLNIGNSQTVTTEDVNAAGFSTLIVTTVDATPTPVQMMASDGAQFIVSATAFIPFQPSSLATDSLRPIINALNADIQTMAKSITKK